MTGLVKQLLALLVITMHKERHESDAAKTMQVCTSVKESNDIDTVNTQENSKMRHNEDADNDEPCCSQ